MLFATQEWRQYFAFVLFISLLLSCEFRPICHFSFIFFFLFRVQFLSVYREWIFYFLREMRRAEEKKLSLFKFPMNQVRIECRKMLSKFRLLGNLSRSMLIHLFFHVWTRKRSFVSFLRVLRVTGSKLLSISNWFFSLFFWIQCESVSLSHLQTLAKFSACHFVFIHFKIIFICHY